MTTEQQTNLKFLVHLGKSPSDALCILQQVYKEQTLFCSTVFLRHKRFNEGCENVENDPKCGRTSTSRNKSYVKLVKKTVRGDCRLTVRLISHKLWLNWNSIWQIITDLGTCKVCAKMVPRWFHTKDHPQHPHILCWIFSAREKLLFVDLLKNTESSWRRFSEMNRNLRLVCCFVVIAKSSSKK